VRTIALEEHFWTAGLAGPSGPGLLATWGQQVDDQLRDLGQARLADMDASGIDLQVISHVAPAAQALDGTEGIARAREANDQLAGAVRAHPDRFAGFATLPTADPPAAADELERAVRELGLIGALVNSTLGSNGAFLDEARFAPLLDRFERLDVPLYLHPAPPSAALRDVLYRGLPPAVAGRLATSAWGWHAEAGLHVLRMIVTGVFDRHPGLRLIVGHCGEMVPFMLDRIDTMLSPTRLGPARLGPARLGPARLGPGSMALKPSEYFLRNIWVTTSGLFSLPPVLCAVQVLGVDRVLFSVDYPFGDNAAGRALLDALPLAPADKAKIAGGNAEQVLGLKASTRDSDLRHVDVVKNLRWTGDLRHNDVVKNVGAADAPARGPASPAPTRGQVARLILELGPSTAATLGGRLGLTPAAIRRHLDNLLAEGLIETRTARTYGNRGRGRPAKVFVITDAGRSAFEHAYDDLASNALRFLAETAGPDAIAEFARRQVSDLERRYAPAVARGDLPSRVQALAEALSADGYAASAGPAPAIGGSRAEAGEQLCQHHCPVAHVAAEFPQLCEAETEAFGRLLGTPVQRLATIAHGDGICTTHVTGVGKAPPGRAVEVPVTHEITSGRSREGS
jgi:predicted ArsR family transcriptional regulator/predicted TIM-barrel fold metal-dependent hydrolase